MNPLAKIERDWSDAKIKFCGETQSQKILIGKNVRAVIFKGEKLAAPSTPSSSKPASCDCIILFIKGNCLCVAIVELKSTSIDAKKIIEQLENCYQLTRRMLAEFSGIEIECRMAIYLEGGYRLADQKVIHRRNKKKSDHPPIETRKYGQEVVSLFG